VAARLTRRATVAGWAVVVLLAAGCGIGANSTGTASFAPPTVGPSMATTAAVSETRAALVAALAAKGLQLSEPKVPFLPPESASLASAPRAVYQVVLPADPAHGFVSVYEFADAAAATTAGREQADYVASGPGRVQFPINTRFVIRQVGTTIVFYAWSPDNSPDPRTADIQAALETFGTGIAIPS
jgi:hypothetical protein